MRWSWLGSGMLAGCAHAAPAPSSPDAQAPPPADGNEPLAELDLGADLQLRDEPEVPPSYVLSYERPWVSAYCDGEQSARASSAIEALGAAIARVRPRQDVRLLYLDLLELTKMPCMGLCAGEGVPDPPANGLALQTWWRDGGERWLLSQLHLDEWDTAGRSVVVPPTMRRTLTRDLDRQHPLSSWMCPSTDLACTDATERAYAERMRDDLVLGDSGGHKLSMSWADHDGTEIHFGWGACPDTAALADADHAYAAFRDCIELAAPRTYALPIGGYRAPDDGWLLLQGRRGHYAFCDEIRAYHLGTGATYQASLCGELMSDCEPGQCEPPKIEVTHGNVDPALVREALWGAMWAPESEPGVVLEGQTHALPEGIAASRPARPELPRQRLEGWSSASTRLTWSHTRGGKHRFEGTLDWPSGMDTGRDYATRVVQAMEATLQSGCPKAELPTMPIYERASGVSMIDAHPGDLAVTQRKLVQALREAARVPCTP